jgi:hypothetical protein
LGGNVPRKITGSEKPENEVHMKIIILYHGKANKEAMKNWKGG